MKTSHVVSACAVALVLASPAHAQLGGLMKGAQVAKKVADLNISEEQEHQIGAQVSQNIRQRYGVVQDAAVHKYVTLVGAALAVSSTRPGIDWQFIVLDTDGVNAFAAPGGFVHITRGALGLLKNESELAGVLGHEIIHITEKHTINAIKKSKAKDLGTDLAPGGGLTKAALSKLADAATEAVLMGFGRGEELESDTRGLALTNTVGYDPRGLGGFLSALKARNSGATEKQGLFASHPEMDERLKKLDKTIADQKMSATATLDVRYKKFISYKTPAQAGIATVAAGSAGLAGGTSSKGGQAAQKTDAKADEEPKKKGRFGGLAGKLTGGGDEKKQAQVTGSGAGRGVNTEKDAKGGSNPALVAVKITMADITAFKKEGKLN